MQYIVKVGATANPVGRNAEFSGYNYYGPTTGEEAQAFADKVRAEFDRVREDHKGEPGTPFVYGTPEVEVIPFRGDMTFDPARAAANWYADAPEEHDR